MSRLSLEDEHLDREVGIDVAVAHEAHYPAFGELLDLLAHLGAHDVLPSLADVEDRCPLSRGGERPLALREVVLEHDEDAVLAEGGLGLRRALAGCLGEHVNDRGRDGRAELAVSERVLSGHVATGLSSGIGTALSAGALAVRPAGCATRSISNQTDVRRPVGRPQRSASSWTRCSPRPASSS